MDKSFGYSPKILIYLDVAGKAIRLADVLEDSATLYGSAEVPASTAAKLVFSIDGQEDRQDVILNHGISKHDSVIKFTYQDEY